MKKFLKVTALSVTACTLLGTSMVSAADTETTGSTTVTYEPGIASPTGASWAVSYTATVKLNNTNVGENVSDIKSKGQDITFTVFDNGMSTDSHNSNEQIKVTLPESSTGTDGAITMDVAGTHTSEPVMKLTDTSGSSFLDASSAAVEIATLVNTTTGSANQYTATIKAGLTSTGEMASDAKASKELTFKFTKIN